MEGVPLEDRLDDIGYRGAGTTDAAARDAWVELHIEPDGTAVATVGELGVEPNARDVVPESITATLDIRDVDEGVMDAMVDRVKQAGARVTRERPVAVTVDHYRHDPPSEMSSRCTDAAREAAESLGIEHLTIHSDGMHDTALLTDVTDAGLLFAPSKDGVSHSPREWTDWEDCAAAAGVLAQTLVRLTS